MQRFTHLIAFAFATALALTGCGATVGDPCTTPRDCGNGLCINEDYTPGGYCSTQCVVGDDTTCPSGTRCVKEGAGKDVPACFIECATGDDCRSGYVCERVKDHPFKVCIGREGF